MPSECVLGLFRYVYMDILTPGPFLSLIHSIDIWGYGSEQSPYAQGTYILVEISWRELCILFV